MTTQPDFLSRAQSGDVHAFEQLVTHFEGRVYQMAFRSTNNAEDAADITQEVFVRVWRRLAEFRGQSALSTWMYRVTMNLCIDHARRKTTRVQTAPLHDEEGEALPTPDATPAHNPEQAYDAATIREELHTAMETLSEEHRQVVLLRDVSGLSYLEIAETLKITQGTVKSRLARGRDALRKNLLSRGNISLPSASKQQERRQEDAEL